MSHSAACRVSASRAPNRASVASVLCPPLIGKHEFQLSRGASALVILSGETASAANKGLTMKLVWSPRQAHVTATSGVSNAPPGNEPLNAAKRQRADAQHDPRLHVPRTGTGRCVDPELMIPTGMQGSNVSLVV